MEEVRPQDTYEEDSSVMQRVLGIGVFILLTIILLISLYFLIVV